MFFPDAEIIRSLGCKWSIGQLGPEKGRDLADELMNSWIPCNWTRLLCNYEIFMNHMPVKSGEKNKKELH